MKSTICMAHPSNPCNGSYGKSLDVKLTNDCNGSCAFCIEQDGYRPSPGPIERLVDATNKLHDYQKVLILGGEPLLHTGLVKYLKGIQRKEEVYITTNGALLDEELAAKTAIYLTGINISLHHYIEEKNAKIVGARVDYLQLERAIAVFRAAKVRVRINTNLIAGVFADEDDLWEMNCFAAGLGANEIRFAELQNSEEGFVAASEYIAGLPQEPFTEGCETVVAHSPDFKTVVRQTCGLVNPCKPMPTNPVCRGSQTKVLYPNCEISDGWKTGACETGVVGSLATKTRFAGCHGKGCHNRMAPAALVAAGYRKAKQNTGGFYG